MEQSAPQDRRSLKYIRLAVFLAEQAPAVTELALTLSEIEEIVGAPLPSNARFPSWWRNDEHRMHSRAWMTAGWKVADMRGNDLVTFVRDRSSTQ